MAKDHKSETILTFILGVGVGAAAALFFAPKSGEELRDDIVEGVSDGVNQARSSARDLKRRAQKLVDVAKEHVEDAIDAGDLAYSQAKKG
jgi:gas vesicle protein